MAIEMVITTREAQAVLVFLERWGMVQGMDGGEDSAGRQRMKLMPPEEVVDRAVAVAELAFARLREKGWIQPGVEGDGEEGKRGVSSPKVAASAETLLDRMKRVTEIGPAVRGG